MIAKRENLAHVALAVMISAQTMLRDLSRWQRYNVGNSCRVKMTDAQNAYD